MEIVIGQEKLNWLSNLNTSYQQNAPSGVFIEQGALIMTANTLNTCP